IALSMSASSPSVSASGWRRARYRFPGSRLPGYRAKVYVWLILRASGPPAANQFHAAGKSALRGRNPGKFQIAVPDLVSTIETATGSDDVVKGAGGTGSRGGLARAEVLGVAAREILVRDRPD